MGIFPHSSATAQHFFYNIYDATLAILVSPSLTGNREPPLSSIHVEERVSVFKQLYFFHSLSHSHTQANTHSFSSSTVLLSVEPWRERHRQENVKTIQMPFTFLIHKQSITASLSFLLLLLIIPRPLLLSLKTLFALNKPIFWFSVSSLVPAVLCGMWDT